jgi:O-antigen/teichoic acid export membrane protein
MAKSLQDQSISAFFWVILDRAGGSVMNFIMTVILARLLSPADFGLVAMVMIFFEISSGFVDSGFYVSLIREPEVSEEDKSTTFIFNFFSALTLYTALFFAAPAIARFFDQPILVWIVRVMGLNLIIGSFDIIQRAQLTRAIDFKTQTKVRFLAVGIAGAVAVVMAYQGFGAWSLVAKFGIMALVNTGALWVVNPWRPSMVFSRASFRRLFGFGYKILLGGLIDRFYQQAYKGVIGKFFSAATLGFYSQASYFSNLIIHNLFWALAKITYPVLAKLQDEKEKLKRNYRKIIKLSSFVILPAVVLLTVLAQPVVVWFIGEKWLPAVPFLKLLCIAGMTYHFNAINLNMLLVLGRADIGLKLEIIKKIFVTIAIIIGIQYGIYGLVIGQVISAYIELFINSYYSNKFLGYAFLHQIKDVIDSLKYSLVAGGFAFVVSTFLDLPLLLTLLVGGIGGGACYLALHFAFHSDEMKLIQHTIVPSAIRLLGRKGSAPSA